MKPISLLRKIRRKKRISSKFFGTAETPRLSVGRSNKYIYAQAIDDSKRETLAAYSSLNFKKEGKAKKTDQAKQVGLKLAQILKEKKIEKLVFDRGPYNYKGRVKALAEGLREGGIKV